MSLFIASLNSGSNGNCYYLGNHEDAVLIDVGLSCRETEKRLNELGLDIQKIKAIFISHEHTDHIRGIEGLSKKYSLPVYITLPTLQKCPFFVNKISALPFYHGQPVKIGSLQIVPFEKKHDAVDPHSFIVESGQVRVAVLTDIGMACKNVTYYFKQCHAAFLEANYDDQMLEQGKYPMQLKKRIRGGKGHLSNSQALNLFQSHRSSFMSRLILSHLSHENNSPEAAQQLFEQNAGDIKISVASRYRQTEVYEITASDQENGNLSLYPETVFAKQLSLF